MVSPRQGRAGAGKGTSMGKRDALIALYAEELRNRCAMEPEMGLLERVTIGTGPAIYDAEAAVIDPSRPGELEHVESAFLVRKLGLSESPELRDAIEMALEDYDTPGPRYRAVLHYMLTKEFGREHIFA